MAARTPRVWSEQLEQGVVTELGRPGGAGLGRASDVQVGQERTEGQRAHIWAQHVFSLGEEVQIMKK